MIDKEIMEIVVRKNESEDIFIRYNSMVIPHIGDTLQFPRHGSFTVVKVVHYIFDDAPLFKNNRQGWVEIYIKECK